MKITGNRIFSFMLAAAFALTLAGCGGGGGGTPAAAKCPDGQVGTPPNCTTPPPKATDDEKFAARAARDRAETARMDAMAAMGGDDGSVAMTAAAATAAAGSASAAADSASMAMAGRTDYANAKKASDEAAGENTKAATAKTAADGAQTALDDAVTVYNAAVDGQDIETKAGALAIKAAADTLRAAAMKAQADAAKAQADAEAARDAAKSDAADAAKYAAMHVLGLLKAANPADDPDTDGDNQNENANRVKAVTASMTSAAGATPGDGNQREGGSNITVTISYNRSAAEDDEDTKDVDESAPVYAFAVTGPVEITNDEFTADTPTAKKKDLMDLGGFKGFELEKTTGGSTTYVHAYTDITAQKIHTTPVVKTQGPDVGNPASTQADATAPSGWSPGKGEAHSFMGKYDHDNDTATKSLSGVFICTGDICGPTYTITAGKFTTLPPGYLFRPDPVTTGGEPTLDSDFTQDGDQFDRDGDFLTFGVWLQVPDTTGASNTPDSISSGVFASGNDPYTVTVARTGTASYSGPAVGVKSMGGAVSHVDGTASLDVNFGTKPEEGDDTSMGTIEGTVSLGADTIRLIRSNIDADGGGFNGNTSMGPINDTTAAYKYNGKFGGRFYGPDTDSDGDAIEPGSAAGTFGVTGGKDDDAMSIIGAFGAHNTQQ